MPTYQYVCTECGEPLEVVQKFSDDALTECPACQGKLRKVFSAAGIIFKGSGFYRTDSRGGSTSTVGSPAKSASNGSSDSSSNGSSNGSTASSDSSTSSSSTSSTSSEKVA
ncbi:hypothetical protein GCM10009678_37820 [Actinomadura kijaniata]|uniref:Putative FmdB family regulatory protein n=1 Tax=Actinomadura namibiensis TaxID=182080 RepID=A0A7W3LZG5_ACTNM|nr:FmdB family zinc ribbon protein [Actinomadura namibiensis]MBA8957054.1 putative FmdB family regulatory protein [Actinomadura namibiensis]